jgi:hypothetical protein
MTSFASEFGIYVGRARQFGQKDWVAYVLWIGTIFGLFASTSAFLFVGRAHGVHFPAEAYLIPFGALLFTVAIAIDTIGHRTIYRDALEDGEALVHHITIAMGILSVVALVLAYQHRIFVIPAIVLTALSVLYSLVDKAFHWRRYLSVQADRVEMWNHVLIMTGHGIMMMVWWWFYAIGYPGVRETLDVMR